MNGPLRRGYVDAEPVRRHVLALREAGIGRRQLARLAGVSPEGIQKLLNGCPSRGTAPSKTVRAATAKRLLAVRPNLDNAANTACVDATGTHRRLQALIRLGWTQTVLAHHLGTTQQKVGQMLNQRQVLARTARSVREVYDRLWDKFPPATTIQDKIAATRARNIALANGWAPPLAWDDDTIDDPAATPQGIAVGPSRRGTKLPSSDELRYLLQSESIAVIASRYGVREDSIHQALRRNPAA